MIKALIHYLSNNSTWYWHREECIGVWLLQNILGKHIVSVMSRSLTPVYEKMESESEIASTRKLNRKSDLPLDLPSLATAYVRQNNDLRKQLHRFEQERQKKMKIIDNDIWELQKFMQDLKCVTPLSAEDISWRQRRKSSERRLAVKLDTFVSKNLQAEPLTTQSPKSVPSTPSRVSINCQKIKSVEQTQTLFIPSKNSRPFTGIFAQECKTEDFVCEMCSETVKNLNLAARHNQALLRRKKFLDVRKAAATMSYEHAELQCSKSDLNTADENYVIHHNVKEPVSNNEDGIYDKSDLANRKLTTPKK